MFIVDIDGVICNCNKWLIKEIEERTNVKVKETNPITFQYGFDIPNEELNLYIRDALIKYKDDITPYDFVRTSVALGRLEYFQGKINYVTARPNGEVEKATHYWLQKFFGDNYILHSLGEGADKKMWMQRNGGKAIVEDRLKTVNNITNPFISVYLVNRPWNMGRYTAPHVKRVNDLLEAVEDYYSV